MTRSRGAENEMAAEVQLAEDEAGGGKEEGADKGNDSGQVRTPAPWTRS